jgi:hypothetical protein
MANSSVDSHFRIKGDEIHLSCEVTDNTGIDESTGQRNSEPHDNHEETSPNESERIAMKVASPFETPKEHGSECSPQSRWEKRGSWLILINVFFCHIIIGITTFGFSMYYIKFIEYFDVSAGIASLIETTQKAIGIPAGMVKDNYPLV